MIAAMDGVSRVAAAEQRPEPRLVRAAHEFEAQMMKELLAPMTRTGAVFAEGDGEDSGILGEFASESLAGALSAGGGLGIADRITHALSGHATGTAPAIAVAQTNLGMSADK
jgi:Rod binding domain-containing protein